MLGGPHPDPHQLIAPAPAVEPGEPLPPQPEDLSGLYPGRDGHADRSLHGGHLDLVPEGSLAEGDDKVVEEVISVPHEPGIVLDLQENDDVPSGSAPRSGISSPPEGQEVVGADTRRDLHLHLPVLLHSPLTPTHGTRPLDGAPLPTAHTAGSHRHKLAEHRALDVPFFPRPPAVPARRRGCTGSGTGALATPARLQQAHPDLLGDPRPHLLQREGQADPDGLSLARIPTARHAASPASENLLEAAEPTKVSHEDLDGIREVEPAEARGAPYPLFAEPIVRGPLLGIPKDLVGLRDLLEAVLGLLRSLVAVGVVLQRELPIGLLDLFGGGAPGDAEALIVISHSVYTFVTFPPTPRPAGGRASMGRGQAWRIRPGIPS
jgi:hypothetical protein